MARSRLTCFERPGVKTLLTVALWLIVAGLAWRSATFLARAAVRPSHGFAAYYTTARLVREGADTALTYDDAWFVEQIHRFQPEAADVNINPPATSLLLLPLAGLDYAGARLIWTSVNLFALFAILWWIVREKKLARYWFPGLAALAIIFQPVRANFDLGQAYILVLLLLVLAWTGYRRQLSWLLGLSLGLLVVFKLAGLFLLALLLIEKRWRALQWTGGTILAVFLASLRWLGLASWRRYGEVVFTLGEAPERAVSAYQATFGLMRHLLTYDAQWNQEPILIAPQAGRWLPWLVLAVLLSVTLVVAFRSRPGDELFASFIILGVITSPLSLHYHYSQLLLPVAILLADARTRSGLWSRLILLVGIILIAVNVDYRSPELAAGWRAFLAYPKLYGGLILWAWAPRHYRDFYREPE